MKQIVLQENRKLNQFYLPQINVSLSELEHHTVIARPWLGYSILDDRIKMRVFPVGSTVINRSRANYAVYSVVQIYCGSQKMAVFTHCWNCRIANPNDVNTWEVKNKMNMHLPPYFQLLNFNFKCILIMQKWQLSFFFFFFRNHPWWGQLKH